MLSLITSCNAFVDSPIFFNFKPTLKMSSFRHLPIYSDDSFISSLESPGNGELKLLTHLNAENWAHNWLMHISDESTPQFDEHYYRDFLNMLSVAPSYTSKEFFYLGFFPKDSRNYEGPRYIGVFELIHPKRTFDTIMIMENPHYLDDPSDLIDFKHQIIHLTESSFVFFRFDKLRRPEQMRYFLEWMHM